MSTVCATPESVEGLFSGGFAALDRAYEDFEIAPDDLAHYGQFAIANARILDTPADVVERGYVLTNPSQIETIMREIGDQSFPQDFAYFRHEPASLHLGHTTSVPYLIRKDKTGNPYLDDFEAAKTLVGEDPRIARDVRRRGVAGKIHKGWLISTTVATPRTDDPAYPEGIKQVFQWGETLASLEPIAELEDTKNVCIYPVGEGTKDVEDTRLDLFGRPKPDTSYLRLPDIEALIALTPETLKSRAINITENFLPEGVYCGPNFVKGAGPDYRELDIHEAVVETLPDDGRWVLHYRLGRYGYELPRDGLSMGRLIPLGVIATRGQFPDAPAKPPENGIADYSDVLYGSIGKVDRTVAIGSRAGRILVGASDNGVGLADVIRVG